MMRAGTVAVLLAVAWVPVAGRAVELADGKLNLNGDGEWAYLRNDHGRYLADPESPWANVMFDLLVTARATDQLSIVAQLGFDPEDVGLEWGFAEWRFSDHARARVGKVKHPFGNYAELQFAGTARPFFTLATSVYGPSDMAASAVNGVSLTGDWFSEAGWGFQYDVYGGGMELSIYEPYDALVGGINTALHREQLNDFAGARLSLTTPSGLVLRASGYGGDMKTDEGRSLTMVTSGLSAFYRGEKLWLSVEAFHSAEYKFERQLAAYAEAAWFLTSQVQVAARWEASRVKLDELSGSDPLLRHDEVAAGLNYWFTPEFVVKASVHRVSGFRFAEAREPGAPGGERTLLFVGGAQFAF